MPNNLASALLSAFVFLAGCSDKTDGIDQPISETAPDPTTEAPPPPPEPPALDSLEDVELLHAIRTEIYLVETFSCDDPAAMFDGDPDTFYRTALDEVDQLGHAVVIGLPEQSRVSYMRLKLGPLPSALVAESVRVRREQEEGTVFELSRRETEPTRLDVSGEGGQWTIELVGRSGRLSIAEIEIWGPARGAVADAHQPTIHPSVQAGPVSEEHASALVRSARRDYRRFNGWAEHIQMSDRELSPEEEAEISWGHAFRLARLAVTKFDLATRTCTPSVAEDPGSFLLSEFNGTRNRVGPRRQSIHARLCTLRSDVERADSVVDEFATDAAELWEPFHCGRRPAFIED